MKLTLLRKVKHIKALAIAALIVGYSAAGTAQCNYTLACNDGVQVSLSNTCEEEITPDMILESQELPGAAYEVNLYDENGELIPNATVTGDHIGMTIEASVTMVFLDCNLTCWGYLTVEDKLPPLFTCPANITINCGESISPDDIGRPTPTDCSGVADAGYSDEEIEQGCTDPYAGIINRTWYAEDIFGNVGTCIQTIHIMKADLADITFPADYLVTCEAHANAGVEPDVTGMPGLVACSNIQYYFEDFEFPLCGDGTKILREWHVVDWCTGEDTVGTQTIKIEDTAPPVIQCGITNFALQTNADGCVIEYSVPVPGSPGAPQVIFDCSEVHFAISYAPFPEGLDCNSLEDATEILNDANISLTFIEILPNANGEYIVELPQGCNWIQYDFWDDCGHMSFCTKDVFVEDALPPTAICEGYTNVSVDATGWGWVTAESIDDHSWDDCGGELTYEIRRLDYECDDLPASNPDDLTFDDVVHFCCEDVGENIVVEFRVTDEAGNYNICQANVFVDDKFPPLVTCPSNVTLGCGQDYTNVNLTGMPSFTDNCGADVEPEYTEFLNECGIGTVRIDWTITDSNDNEIPCTQTVFIVNNDPLDENDIIWPPDLDIVGCDDGSVDPESIGSEPIFTNSSDCSNIGTSHEDLRFYDVPGYCVKIVRVWTIVDWCADPVTFHEYSQKIHINNFNAPTISGCSSYTFDPTGDCEGDVDLWVTVEDDCTPSNLLSVNWRVDFYDDGTTNDSGSGVHIQDTWPTGRHRVYFDAIDECDNSNSCAFFVNINDNVAPTPVCLTEVVWGIGSDGTTEVWASDFDFKSYDNCSPDADLIFSFNLAGTQQSMTFDCDDLENGIAQEIELTMYVIDTEGLSDFCTVTLILQDNQDVCQDMLGAMGRIEGNVTSVSDEVFEELEVELHDMTILQDDMEMTSTDGDYAFSDLLYYNEYMIQPVKNDDYLNGVSTLDLVLIQKHVLGLQNLDSPEKIIAADVNKSDNITAIDIVELRKLILGIYTELPSSNSWRFIPSDHEYDFPLQPWGYPENIEIYALLMNQMHADFTGIKVGDVNQSANINFNNIAVESRSKTTIAIADQKLVAGETFEFDLNIEDTDIYGLQLELAVQNETISLNNVSSELFGFNQSNWAQDENGQLRISWSSEELRSSEKITLTFTALKDAWLSDVVALGENMDSEYYGAGYENIAFEIEMRGKELNKEAGLVLGQNKPNPFQANTFIDFYNDKEEDLNFQIMDMSGKVIFTDLIPAQAGVNTIEINRNELQLNVGI